MNMTRHHLMGVLLLVAALHATPVVAAPSSKARLTEKPAQILFMLGQGGTYTVPVGIPLQTFLDFPGQLRTPSTVFQNPYFEIKPVDDNTLRVVPHPDAPMGASVSIHVDFVVNSANFNFVIGDRQSAVEFLHVRVGSLEDLREIATEIAGPQITEANKRADEADKRADEANKRADETNKRADEANKRAEAAEEETVYLQARGLLDQLDGFPPCRMPLLPVQEAQRSKAASRTNLRLLQSCWDDKKIHLLVPFEFDNHDPAPFQPSQLEVRGMDAKVYPARVVLPRPKKAGADGVLPRVGPRERIRGVLSINLSDSQAADKLVIRFSEAGNQRWVGATITAYSFMRAVVLAAPADDWEREILAREAREKRAVQLILSPSMAAGYCWLGIGIDGMSDVDATSCLMLGGRLVKGITETFAFQAEIMGGSTGAAEFEGFTRSANFGRATLGVMLRFGDMRIPYARVGVGAQGTSYNVSDGGPETKFEFSVLWTFGAGYDLRLGKLLIGVEVFAEQRMDDNQFKNSLGLGAHFGYGWNP